MCVNTVLWHTHTRLRNKAVLMTTLVEILHRFYIRRHLDLWSMGSGIHILFYTIYYTIPYYTILYCTILHNTILYYTILYYTIHLTVILHYHGQNIPVWHLQVLQHAHVTKQVHQTTTARTSPPHTDKIRTTLVPPHPHRLQIHLYRIHENRCQKISKDKKDCLRSIKKTLAHHVHPHGIKFFNPVKGFIQGDAHNCGVFLLIHAYVYLFHPTLHQ